MSTTSKNLAKTVFDILKNTLPASDAKIALHQPVFEGNEWKYVKECLDTGWVSSVGAFVDRFERDLATTTGVPHAIAAVNGTAALHIALKLVGVEAGDEVLIPNLTFVATANAVTYCNAVPHLLESTKQTLGLDPEKLDEYLREITTVQAGICTNKKTGRRIKALVPVHIFGHPCDMDALTEICNRYHLGLVEDATESLGSFYKGAHTGGHGHVSVLSFNGNKINTTGGGGAILTKNKALGAAAKHLTTTAKQPHAWAFDHDAIGYNYRLPNINAALGCAQLEQLPKFVEQKRALAKVYAKAFANIAGIKFFEEPNFAKSNYWLNALILDPQSKNHRDEILNFTNENGIQTRPIWTLMHKLTMFKDSPKMPTPVAEELEATIINIPSSPHLGKNYAHA